MGSTPEGMNAGAAMLSFVTFTALAVALYLLMRVMNAQLRRMSYRSGRRDGSAGPQQPSREGRSPDEPS